jgi:Tol biopolymer transport system component
MAAPSAQLLRHFIGGRALAIGAVLAILTVSLSIPGADKAGAAFRGSNGLIAFETDRDGNSEIYTMKADGSDQARLTVSPGADGKPAWAPRLPGAPQAHTIAFESNRAGNFDIWTVEVDGSALRRVTSDAANETAPAWSPLPSSAGGPQPLIAFETDLHGNREIYVMRPDGSGQRRLTHSPADDANATWSPDGTQVAFESNRTGVYQIWAVNRDGTGLRKVTSGTNAKFDPNWFRFANLISPSPPDAELIAFDVRRSSDDYEVEYLNSDGTPPRVRLTQSAHDDSAPVWSPNGERVVFQSNRDGNYEIYVMASDGTVQRRLTVNGFDDMNPDWQSLTEGAETIPNPPLPGPGTTRTCTKVGNGRKNRLEGTPGPDVLCGKGGADVIIAKGGNDFIDGGMGKDSLVGGRGQDTFSTKDGFRDSVDGGRGSDSARADKGRDVLTRVESRG